MLQPLYFHKLDPEAKDPVRVHKKDAGIDLRSLHQVEIPSFQSRIISTGLSLWLPENTFGMICSRSGLAANNNLFVLNAPGIIDESYRGEIKVVLL